MEGLQKNSPFLRRGIGAALTTTVVNAQPPGFGFGEQTTPGGWLPFPCHADSSTMKKQRATKAKVSALTSFAARS